MLPSIEFLSPLPPDEAESRLRAAVAGEIPLLMLPTGSGDRPLRGSVGAGTFVVRLATTYGNSFAAVYRGRVQPAEHGSRVQATGGMPAATLVVLVIAAIITVPMLLSALADRDGAALLRTLGVLVVAAGIFGLGRTMARAEAAALVAQLEALLESRSQKAAS